MISLSLGRKRSPSTESSMESLKGILCEGQRINFGWLRESSRLKRLVVKIWFSRFSHTQPSVARHLNRGKKKIPSFLRWAATTEWHFVQTPDAVERPNGSTMYRKWCPATTNQRYLLWFQLTQVWKYASYRSRVMNNSMNKSKGIMVARVNIWSRNIWMNLFKPLSLVLAKTHHPASAPENSGNKNPRPSGIQEPPLEAIFPFLWSDLLHKRGHWKGKCRGYW